MKKSGNCLNLLLAAVTAFWKLIAKPFCRPVFIKSVYFNDSIVNAKFYVVPLDEKYYLSYIERRKYFDFKFRKIQDCPGYKTYRHHYALGVFELEGLD